MADKAKKKPPFVRAAAPVPAETHRLSENHGWRCSPGHKICVVGRGDLRFEYPDTWVNSFGEGGSLKLHDRPFPHDDIVLEVSVLRTPVDFTRLPDLGDLLLTNLHKAGHFITPDDLRRVDAPGLEAVWAEYDKTEEDPVTKLPRRATWRQAHCHPGRFYRGAYLPLGVLTYGFWSDHRERADAAWEHLVASIVMGEQIADPRAGPRYN